MQNPDCVFCKIALGKIPSTRVYEDDRAIAFLDIGPLAEGHVLVVPKNHYVDIRDVPPDELANLMRPIPKLSDAILRATSASGLNLLQNTGESAGQAVFHLHFHLIPRTDRDRLGYRWNAGAYAEGRAEEVQKRIIAELGG